MSVTSLGHDLESLHERLMERLVDAVESHGLDPDSPDVLGCIEGWFGDEIRGDFEEWIEE